MTALPRKQHLATETPESVGSIEEEQSPDWRAFRNVAWSRLLADPGSRPSLGPPARPHLSSPSPGEGRLPKTQGGSLVRTARPLADSAVLDLELLDCRCGVRPSRVNCTDLEGVATVFEVLVGLR